MSAVNTGWVSRNYNQRGLIVHNMNTRTLVRTSSGILWAAIRENIQSKYIRVYRSTTNGFSWDLMWQGTFTKPGFRFTAVPGLNTNGPIMQLIVDERRNRLVLFHSMWNETTKKYQIEPFIFLITGQDKLQRIISAAVPDFYTFIDVDMDQMVMNVVHNDDFAYLTYVGFSAIHLLKIRTDEPIVPVVQPKTGTDYFNIHATSVTDNNELDVVVVEDGGANYRIMHTRFSSLTGTWSVAHLISSFPANNVHDLNLVRDGNNVLTAMWTQDLTGGTDITIFYTSSFDNGVTWTTPTSIPKNADQANFKDTATGQFCTRNALIGLLNGGYVVTYVRQIGLVPMCYWRWLTLNTAGTGFDVGPEFDLATNCTGAKFFNPTSTNLVNGNDLSNLRVGYTIGQGNSTVQQDAIPVSLGQKILTENLVENFDHYGEDSPGPNQLPVNFNILGAPNDNVDYYALGLTGTTTKKYMSAFNKIGTNIRLFRYEPTTKSFMDDQSAYENPIEYSVRCVFQPITYELPINTSQELFTSYMERDTRKLYIPPTMHLGRTWTLNSGQHLKRTVWTCAFDGNTYELSQLLPFFLDNEIAFYVANAYVVGASNNPFAREILPSET